MPSVTRPNPVDEAPEPEPEPAPEPEFTANDVQVADDFTAYMAEDGAFWTDSWGETSLFLRGLAEQADNVEIWYSMNGLANDIDGIIENGETSGRLAALQSNADALTLLFLEADATARSDI